MKQNQKVEKIPKRLNINIGVIIFVIILIYTGINVYQYITKPKISIYEVTEQGLAQSNMITGIITREESDILTQNSGYVNYYFRDGAKVPKDATVYSIDESRQIYEKLADYSKNVSMETDDISDIKQMILKYKRYMDMDNYSMIYKFKDDLSATIQSVIDENLLASMETIIGETGITSTFSVVKTDVTGVITYYVDNYDGLQTTGITPSIFNQDNYVRKTVRGSDIVEAGQPVYRMITDDNWKITAMITPELAETLKDMTRLSFTFLLDGITEKAPIRVFQDDGIWYLEISMDKYVVNYSRERFLDMELNITVESGLKIPKTAICEKEFFLIPNNYLTNGGNSTELGVMLEIYDEATGQIIPTFTPCEVYYKNDEYSYVDLETFVYNQYIRNIETNDRFPISMTDKLEGVYNVNKGYAVFRRIERITESKEYVMIKKGSTKGLSVYDHIALNASLITESSVIY